jgi:IS1 family transposase
MVGCRQDEGFLKLKALLELFGIRRYDTDGWGAYERHLDAEQHGVGKDQTQKVESKHMRLRTRIKRLVRRTICFSKRNACLIWSSSSSSITTHLGCSSNTASTGLK